LTRLLIPHFPHHFCSSFVACHELGLEFVDAEDLIGVFIVASPVSIGQLNLSLGSFATHFFLTGLGETDEAITRQEADELDATALEGGNLLEVFILVGVGLV